MQSAAKPRRKGRRLWKNSVMAMAAVVVFCTVYALVLPAITMAGDPICGQTEHTHGDGCYRGYVMTAQCPAADSGTVILHQHSSLCYDGYGQLICPLPEQTEHIHGEGCWVEENTLICPFDEIPAHFHGDECYGEAVETIGCGLEESAGHTHDESCFESCTHLNCGLEESETHTHSDECYVTEQTQICTLAESAGHTHDESCRVTTRPLICQVVETAGHTHDESCYGMRPKLVCTRQQIAVHTHDDSCCNEQGTVVCGITPAQWHDHAADCFYAAQLPERELICTQPEHTHTEQCYPEQEDLPKPTDGTHCGIGAHTHGEGCFDENGNVICTLTEHRHTEPCFVANYDPDADLENPEVWSKTFAHVKLSGNWPRDVLAIAESQLGYRESSRNVKLWEDGSLKGYTRYGAWYGVPHGDWCAMFVSFCLNYAEVTEVPQDSVCNTYIEKLREVELYRDADSYLPKPGDIVFFDWERTGGEVDDVDHAGIVAEVIRDENGDPVQIRTIEGNWENCVMQRTHSITSPTIIGYCDVPFGPEETCICDYDDHVHSNYCDPDCDLPEHIHTEDCFGRSIFYMDDTLLAQLIVSNVELPEDLTMTVTAVTEEQDPNRYGSMAASLEIATEESPYFVGGAGFYHITLMSGGEVYRLPENAKAIMDVTFTQTIFDPAAVAQGSGLYTYLLEPGEPIALFTGDIIDTYESQQAVGESYKNATQGLTGVRLQLAGSNDFAVMLATTTKTGTFWTRVTDSSQLTADGTYMIVSAEGNYALCGNSSGNNTPVIVQTVKGNTQYYTIDARSGSLSNEHYWTFTPSSNNFTVRCKGTSNYLMGSRTSYGSPSVISSYSRALTLKYDTATKCWWIYTGNYYLYNNGGSFSSGRNGGGNDTYYEDRYYARDMLIFKLSDVDSLEIPDDVKKKSDGYDEENAPPKPKYDPFIQPSGEKTGDTSLTDPNDPNLSVPGKYYSDKATSMIEKKLDLDDYLLNAENDGKILTDKSVIYMGDDYEAFSSYAPNTFGVTLSALGQEYEMPDEDIVRTPIDIVFVLDVSGSMTTNGTTDGGAAGSSASRAENMVAATNKTIKLIMEDHPANRVGIVLYATGAWQLLPLDRYEADNDEYLQIQKVTGPMQNNTTKNMTIHFVTTTASLKNEDGTSFANLGRDFNQGYGTYTQAGIALGGKTFADIGDDTTYTEYFGEGENIREYTINRQPVIILLTDGEPTHATNNYMDPLSGPHYGDGHGSPTNAKGIMGYNVILTANYFKRIVGIQYDQPAMFYTVGMGIAETGDTPWVEGSDTGDTYKRAVLNPTPEIIESLKDSMVGGATVGTQLKNLIQSKVKDNFITVTPHWPDPWTGDPHTDVPVLQPNPYADDYSYSDGAYFGEPNADDLAEIFAEIVNESMKSTPYGFILHKSSSIILTDQIGEGMCVKGAPVLRYAGVNYQPKHIASSGNVIHYVYEGKYVHPYLDNRTYDLSHIAVTLTTDAKGNQTMRMYVPDTALPAYSPELIGKQFYYEALPVRLIYQVGLTEESEKKVLDLYETGGTATFYTNRWENGGGQSVANLYPSMENPFYYEILPSGETRYHAHSDAKAPGTNVTDTLGYIVDCSKQQEMYDDGEVVTKVIHKLGNNGKLVFEVPGTGIPVQKQWAGGAKPMAGTQVEVMLYHVRTTETGSEEATYVQSVFLSAETSWKGKFEEVPIITEGYYVIAENIPDGYHPQYTGQTKTLVIDNKSVLVAVVDMSSPTSIPVTLITNLPTVVLPETGGFGAEVYCVLGVLLLAAAIVYITGNGSLRRKEEQ